MDTYEDKVTLAMSRLKAKKRRVSQENVTLAMAMSRLKVKKREVSPENATLVNNLSKMINFAKKEECIAKFENGSISSTPDLELEKYVRPVLIADRDEKERIRTGARIFGLDKQYPDWKNIELVEGKVLAYKLPKTTSDDLQRDFVWDSKTCNFRIHSKPFAQGGQRLAFHAIQNPYKNVVLKQFIMTDQDRQVCYMAIMETTTMAQLMATEFNKISPKHMCYPINFLDVGVLQIAVKDDPVFYNMEDYMPTYDSSFTKWNSNAGFCNEIDYSQTMDAFSHWTYHISKKYLMVVDLQGHESETGFLLTDPAIHCIDTERFGDRNLASGGMDFYLTRHNCNKVCELLEIAKVN